MNCVYPKKCSCSNYVSEKQLSAGKRNNTKNAPSHIAYASAHRLLVCRGTLPDEIVSKTMKTTMMMMMAFIQCSPLYLELGNPLRPSRPGHRCPLRCSSGREHRRARRRQRHRRLGLGCFKPAIWGPRFERGHDWRVRRVQRRHEQARRTRPRGLGRHYSLPPAGQDRIYVARVPSVAALTWSHSPTFFPTRGLALYGWFF